MGNKKNRARHRGSSNRKKSRAQRQRRLREKLQKYAQSQIRIMAASKETMLGETTILTMNQMRATLAQRIMAAPKVTAPVEIKQEPPSPEPAEDPSYCDDDGPSTPSKENLSSEQDDMPMASDFLSVQIKEDPEPSSSMHANHATSDEEMVDAILPDSGPRSPSPEPTSGTSGAVKDEMEWESSKAPAEVQGPSIEPGPTKYRVRTAPTIRPPVQPRWTLKRKPDGSGMEVVSTKQPLRVANGGQGADINKIKEKLKQRMEHHQTKTYMENRIKELQSEKDEFMAKIKANTKANKIDQLIEDAGRGEVRAKFLLDQLRCYGKGTYDWSDETLRVCKEWAMKFPQDYKQCIADFVTLPSPAEMGIKDGDSDDEVATGSDEEVLDDSDGSD